MVVTFLSWIWIGCSAYLCGSAFLAFLQRFGGVGSKDVLRRMISGLLVLTVYAEVFSLFSGVGLALLQRRGTCADEEEGVQAQSPWASKQLPWQGHSHWPVSG